MDTFKVSADYIEWAHGPAASDGQPLARELCGLPTNKRGQVEIPSNRLDLLNEVKSVAYLYVGGPVGENDARAARVINRIRAALSRGES